MLADLTIKDFLAETAGSAPVPGGGSISALNGAIAAALTEMVAHLTVGKKKYAEVEGQMKTIATEAAMIRERLTEYIDKDSEAYDRVFSAFKLPKETPDEQVIRTNAIQSATKEAAIVPMRVAEEIGSVMETIIYVAHKGNQNAVTDACGAVSFTGGYAGYLGVVGKMRKKADELEANAIRVEQKLLDWVKTKL